MSHQHLYVSLRENEQPLPMWRRQANVRRDWVASEMMLYETSQASCLVHVTRQHAFWLVNLLLQDVRWTRFTLSTLTPLEWDEVLCTPTEWEDEMGETSGSHLIGLLDYFSHYVSLLHGFLMDTCPSNPRSFLYCPHAVCREYCCPSVPESLLALED